MMRPADPDLVWKARRGDQQAFTTLLEPLLNPAFRLAVGMLQDRQLAEDAVQEAALKAWQKLDRLHEGRALQPWFLGIVANQCRTTRRSRWWQVIRTDAMPLNAGSRNDTVPEGMDLRGALRRLSADQRLVIVLYFYLDLPLDQVAQITGASYAAVRGRLYRGLREMRIELTTAEPT